MSKTVEYSIVVNGVVKSIKDTESLASAVERLEEATRTLDETQQQGTPATTKRTTAMTEEQRAAARLEASRKKLASLDSAANKEQLRVNQAIRQRQQELARQIQIEELEEGSLKRLRLEAAALNEEYVRIGNATPERAAQQEETGRRLDEIRDKIKSLSEAAGDYRDSVGNYEKAGESLKPFVQGLDTASKASMGLVQTLLTGNQLMVLFGDDSEETAKQAANLQRVLALLSLVQGLNNNLLRDSIASGKASLVVTKAQAVQAKAKAAAEALATKNTLAATVAQKAFNIVAAANPYVLLALAIVSVVGALAMFLTRSEDATKQQKRDNEQRAIALDLLDKQTQALGEASAKRVASIERETTVLEAQGASEATIAAKRQEILEERERALKESEQLNRSAVASLSANLREAAEYEERIARLESNIAGGKMAIATRKRAEKNLEVFKGYLDNLRKEIARGEQVINDRAALETDKAVEAARARQRARAASDATLKEVRNAQDARLRLVRDGYKRERTEAEAAYARQIEDLRTRLAREADLTATARAAIEDQIASLREEGRRKLLDIDKAYRARLLSQVAEAEDAEFALERDGFKRRRLEMEAQQARERAAIEQNIADEAAYTEDEREAMARKLRALEERWARERTELATEEANRRYGLELSAAELFYARLQSLRERLVVRRGGGTGFIDVEATKKEYDKAIAMAGEYVDKLQGLRRGEDEQHARNLKGLQAGSAEYEEEMQRHERAILDISARIGDAQAEQTNLTRERDNVLLEYYGELSARINDVAQQILQIGAGVSQAIGGALQMQIDAINEQVEAIDERIEESVRVREAATERIEELEERMRTAQAGTAEALRVQLQEEMANREAAARQENRLSKEKERLEKEAARKERQAKRAEMLVSIATGITNTAVGATKALGMGPILGPILAAMISALGAVQVGIMTAQLAKLRDGGMLYGPSHEGGGMRVEGTNIEVEGGEFVANRDSTRHNRALVEYINDAGRSRTLTLADLAGIIPTGGPDPGLRVPALQDRTDEIIEALGSMELRPVVAVTDIIDRTKEVVSVRDLAGYDG